MAPCRYVSEPLADWSEYIGKWWKANRSCARMGLEVVLEPLVLGEFGPQWLSKSFLKRLAVPTFVSSHAVSST